MKPGRSSVHEIEFYRSKRWRQLRGYILRRDKYRCQISARYGKNVEANTVHHIFPMSEFPAYRWSTWNLIAVSAENHDRLHNRNDRSLTDEGADLLIRTARKRGIDVERWMDARMAGNERDLSDPE